MEIGFIYPDMDMDYYVDTIDSFNGDISKENLHTLLPRLLVTLLLNVLVYAVWFVLLKAVFLGVTEYVTAKKVEIIGMSLLGVVLFIIFSLEGIILLRKKLRPVLLKALRSQEAKESFSMSAYVERRDDKKLIREEVGYYKMCDILKKSKVVDATAVCDGSMCRVEVQYENPTDSSIFTFNLPYHDSDVEHVIVDLNRKCVIFPKEDKKHDEN